MSTQGTPAPTEPAAGPGVVASMAGYCETNSYTALLVIAVLSCIVLYLWSERQGWIGGPKAGRARSSRASPAPPRADKPEPAGPKPGNIDELIQAIES
jgi:hypothetical protein